MKRYEQKFTEGVAEIILQQLGGNKFFTMTGAKPMMKDKNWITLKLPKAKNGIKVVKITLNVMDTYDLEFGKMRSGNYQVIKEVNDVYAEDLQKIFTDVTGLYTSL